MFFNEFCRLMTALCDSFAAMSPPRDTKPELLTSLTVELETGHFEVLDIGLEDEPQKLAEDFLKSHNIDLKIKELLAKNIKDAKEKALRERTTNKKKTSKSVADLYPTIFYQNLPYFECLIPSRQHINYLF